MKNYDTLAICLTACICIVTICSTAVELMKLRAIKEQYNQTITSITNYPMGKENEMVTK